MSLARAENHYDNFTGPPADGSKQRRKSIGQGWMPYVFLLPAVIVVGAVIVYPTVRTFVLSLYSYNLLRPQAVRFVGLANYVELLSRSEFWMSLLNTVWYTAGSVALTFGLGLAAALVLNARFRGRVVVRTLVFLPWAVPWLVTTLIWKNLLDAQISPLNYVLERLGLLSDGIPWLFNTSTAMWSVIVVTAWKYLPFATMIILAGLQSISPELHEAAVVDGASDWERFRYITLPGIRTVNSIALILLTIWIFKLFTIVYVLTAGGPGNATMILSVLTYEEAFTYYQIGMGSALAVMVLLISLGLVTVYMKLLKVR